MRQECEVCGEFAHCKDGICNDCLLEKLSEEYNDDPSEEVEKEETEEIQTTDSRGSTVTSSQD
jgi:hypothetical protein